MTLPKKPNVRRITFQKECYEALEKYLIESEMKLNHKEFVLDLAALVDFLDTENYVGAHYIANVLAERLKTKVAEWERLAKLHVPKDYEVPVTLHSDCEQE
jgi:hypothetical protein